MIPNKDFIAMFAELLDAKGTVPNQKAQPTLSSLLKEIVDEATQILNLNEQKDSSQKEDVIDAEKLVKYYSNLINETFMHTRKRTQYVLLELLNVKSTDSDKFPIMASYYDKQLKTKWCRPLTEFHQNFKLKITA